MLLVNFKENFSKMLIISEMLKKGLSKFSFQYVVQHAFCLIIGLSTLLRGEIRMLESLFKGG